MRGKTSLHLGKTMSMKHNLRTYDEEKWNKDNHIDKERSHLNVYEHTPLKEFFDKQFGEALVAFNEKQYAKHPERVIGMSQKQITATRNQLEERYGKDSPKVAEKLEKIKREKAVSEYYRQQKKNAQEAMIQMSDSQNFLKMIEEKGFEKAVEIHREFMEKVIEDWEKNNPSLKIFSYSMHFDEATPHLHLDFIPIAESSRGLTCKVSMEGALQQLGFKREQDQKYSETPYKQWRKAESLRIDKVASAYMEIVPNEPSASKGHDEYWQHKYKVEAEKGMKKLISEFTKKPTIETAKKLIENGEALNEALTSEGKKTMKQAQLEMSALEQAKRKAQAIIDNARVSEAFRKDREKKLTERETKLASKEALLNEREALLGVAEQITARKQAERIMKQNGYVPESYGIADIMRAEAQRTAEKGKSR